MQGFIAPDLPVGFGLVLDGAVAGDQMRGRVEQDLDLYRVGVGLVL